MTVAEISQVIQGQTRFHLSTIELIRRELVSYGVAVSNMAEETWRKRLELNHIAGYIRDMLDKVTGKTEVAEGFTDQGVSAEGSTNPGVAAPGVSAGKIKGFTFPKVLLKQLICTLVYASYAIQNIVTS